MKQGMSRKDLSEARLGDHVGHKLASIRIKLEMYKDYSYL